MEEIALITISIILSLYGLYAVIGLILFEVSDIDLDDVISGLLTKGDRRC